MNLNHRWISLANKKAKESSHDRYKMAALILKGGNVLAYATNDQVVGQHAEIRAMNRLGSRASGATIVVVRDNGRVSRPCRMCFFKIQEIGISTMIFIDENGDIVRKRVNRETPNDYKEFSLEWE